MILVVNNDFYLKKELICKLKLINFNQSLFIAVFNKIILIIEYNLKIKN